MPQYNNSQVTTNGKATMKSTDMIISMEEGGGRVVGMYAPVLNDDQEHFQTYLISY